MTTNEEGDVSQVSPLLKQIRGLLASVTADGAYDGEPVCRAVPCRGEAPAPPARGGGHPAALNRNVNSRFQHGTRLARPARADD